MATLTLQTLILTGVALLAATPSAAAVITLTNSMAANVDNAVIARTFTILPTTPGFESGTIVDVNLSVDFLKADGEDLVTPGNDVPYFGEIILSLVAPSGETVRLINRNSFNNGEPGTLFDGVVTFDSAAGQPVNMNRDLLQPGTFRPVDSFTTLFGESAAGTFTLLVQDADASDSLRFRSATLTVTTLDAQASPVPEPSSLMMLTAGVLGLAGWGRLRRAQG